MASTNSRLEEYIAEEIRKYRGVMVPVKASVLERSLIRKVRPEQLHPNPYDEFCDPAIGPNHQIISKYVQMISRHGSLQPDPNDDPIIVEKVYPDGYLILNGHHRWAAAIKTGFRMVPIQIVNLTQETDIEEMIRKSRHDKRVTLDLEEVIFCMSEGEEAEKPLGFPYNRMFKERIRRGVPALLHYLGQQGYDIWIYTSGYYSHDYLSDYFKRYTVKIDGLITGAGRKGPEDRPSLVDHIISSHYQETLHIDRSLVLRTWRKSKDFREYPIPEGQRCSSAVLKIVEDME